MKSQVTMYRMLNNPLGKSLLRLVGTFITVPGLSAKKTAEEKPFNIIFTIDTESGFVQRNDERMWQHSKPDAYVGYTQGIKNWRELFAQYNVKATFFLSPNCFNAYEEERNKIIEELKQAIAEGHEIGLHIHPDSDRALQKKLNKHYENTSAHFYTAEELSEMVFAGKQLIKEHLGIDVESIRWGNWALSSDAVAALQKHQIKRDSSATPGIAGHEKDGMKFDWSRVLYHYPWMLSLEEYQDLKKQDSSVRELPIATFDVFGKTLRADPVYTELLNAGFNYYYKHTDRSEQPFPFVIISHSSEGTMEDGSKSRVIYDTERFIRYAKTKSVSFCTLRDA